MSEETVRGTVVDVSHKKCIWMDFNKSLVYKDDPKHFYVTIETDLVSTYPYGDFQPVGYHHYPNELHWSDPNTKKIYVQVPINVLKSVKDPSALTSGTRVVLVKRGHSEKEEHDLNDLHVTQMQTHSIEDGEPVSGHFPSSGYSMDLVSEKDYDIEHSNTTSRVSTGRTGRR